LTDVKTNPEHLRILENWMRSLKPEELFDEHGKVRPEIAEFAPRGQHRMSASPHANGEPREKLRLPDFGHYAVKIDRPGNVEVENVPPLGAFLRCPRPNLRNLTAGTAKIMLTAKEIIICGRPLENCREARNRPLH
jgi:phosphoketolase